MANAINIFVEILTTLFLFYKAIFIAIFKTIVGAPVKSVDGQTVLITGAGSGLGRLVAVDLAQRGAKVIAWDISQVGNEETARQIREIGRNVHTYTVDISKASAVRKAANQVKTDIGDVDILINNAGVVTGKRILECSDEAIIKTFEVNVLSHFWTTQCFLQSMLDKDSGHIVNVASMAGMIGCNKMGDYCASKFADVGFSECLDLEIQAAGRSGVKVTTVCPYFTNTGMFEGAKTKFPLILPVLRQEDVARKIVMALLTNQKLLCIPRIMYLIIIAKAILPSDAVLALHKFLGANNLMDNFVGRQKSD